ncbi:hypothetical protein TNIN_13891 [Trichonephila inaurata madagascariensis]|uniref:Uncharacterized protein n=1 Tax=Trichonephila inaurata madagascariensis TaxID=2747483 RepID=A0A8X6YSQ1_9ARAC|nr:hypothetical protein TNIN_13891 [Trichonephila inaurata madagascariensis]
MSPDSKRRVHPTGKIGRRELEGGGRRKKTMNSPRIRDQKKCQLQRAFHILSQKRYIVCQFGLLELRDYRPRKRGCLKSAERCNYRLRHYNNVF